MLRLISSRARWPDPASLALFAFVILAGCLPARSPEANPDANGQRTQGEAGSAVAGDKVIVLVADEWMPFNGVPGRQPEGYMIDIAREVFQAHSYRVEYRNVAWSRALQGTRDGMFDGAVGASKRDGEGLVFPEEELADNYLAFYVRKGDGWRFTGEESLAGRCLGVIKSYDYRPWLADYIHRHEDDPETVQILTGETPLQQNIRKLLLKRIDVVVDTEASVRHTARGLGVLDRIEPAGRGEIPAMCYIAFTPADPKGGTYARWLSEGIGEMRVSGRLAEILESYGLEDWRSSEIGNPHGEHPEELID